MSADNKPSYRAFIVTDKGEGVKADWKEVAVTFSHKDGKGHDLLIPAGMALSGRITLRESSERPEQGNGVKQAAKLTQ
jgi:hypothetical protein